MSLYSQYLIERTNDGIIETLEGFATYRYVSPTQVYIIDIFVLPEFRQKGYASGLADMIVKKAKERNCTELIGTVNPSTKGAQESMLVLIAYGMKLLSSSDNLIVFKKEI